MNRRGFLVALTAVLLAYNDAQAKGRKGSGSGRSRSSGGGRGGCGSKGGPGYRKSNGQCASWKD